MKQDADLDKFVKSEAPARQHSILTPRLDALAELAHAGYTQKQMLKFLNQVGITVSQGYLSKFLRTHGIASRLPAADHATSKSAVVPDSASSSHEARSADTLEMEPTKPRAIASKGIIKVGDE